MYLCMYVHTFMYLSPPNKACLFWSWEKKIARQNKEKKKKKQTNHARLSTIFIFNYFVTVENFVPAQQIENSGLYRLLNLRITSSQLIANWSSKLKQTTKKTSIGCSRLENTLSPVRSVSVNIVTSSSTYVCICVEYLSSQFQS